MLREAAVRARVYAMAGGGCVRTLAAALRLDARFRLPNKAVPLARCSGRRRGVFASVACVGKLAVADERLAETDDGNGGGGGGGGGGDDDYDGDDDDGNGNGNGGDDGVAAEKSASAARDPEARKVGGLSDGDSQR